MKSQFRFRLIPITSAVLVLALTSACGAGSKQEGSAGSVSAPKEVIQINVWTPMNVNAKAVVKSLNEVSMVQEWQKRTNVAVSFQHPSGNTTQDDVQQYGIMIASNNLPDAMMWNWNNVQGGLTKMNKDGTIVKLNELIDKHAPNLKKLMADHPQVAKQIKSDNGDIYVLPHLRVGQYGQYKSFSGMMIRQDWLDELGLKQPVTMDEWENVLRTFKEKKGVIPFTMNRDYPISTSDFAGAFGVPGMGGGGTGSFYLSDGKVKFGPAQPEFKQYLATMQRWYKEGLIDPDFASNDAKTMDAKVTSGKAGAFFGFIGGSMGTYMPALQKSEPKASLTALQYPVLKQGEEPKFVKASWEYANAGTVITSANKHPEETVKAFDYLYSQEGAMLKNFGIEGQTYKLKDGQPQYTELILKNPEGLPIAQSMAKHLIANYPFTGLDDDRYNDQYYQLPAQKEAVKVYAKFAGNAFKVMLPPVSLTSEEAKETAKILNDVSTLLQEQITKVVMGANSLDSYDKALEQVNKMNLNRAIEVYQAAVDRYNKR